MQALDKNSSYSLVTDRVEDIDGFYMHVGGRNGTKLWVSDFLIVVDKAGYYQIRYAGGVDAETGKQTWLGSRNEQGMTVPLSASPGECVWETISACFQRPNCDECSAAPACDCQDANGGGCTTGSITLCEGDCAIGSDCATGTLTINGIPILLCYCA